MFACTLPAVLNFVLDGQFCYISLSKTKKNACQKFHLLNAKYNVCIFQV
jgi:hypothetical protein